MKYWNDMFRYNSAKKDNDFVYHEKIPAVETLPEVKGNSVNLDLYWDITKIGTLHVAFEITLGLRFGYRFVYLDYL